MKAPSEELGEWYIATRALANCSVDDLHIAQMTGATVLIARKGFFNESLNRYDTELFLWGTPEQLRDAQERYCLQTSEDAFLCRPEPYWG